MEVFFFLPDGRKRDIDNMLKSLWDILERAEIIANDDLIWETKTVKVKKSETDGTVIVIRPFRGRPRLLEKYKKLLEEFKASLDS